MSTVPQVRKPLSDDALRRALQFAADGVAGMSGEGVFQYLTDHLARALGVNYALIGVLTGDDSRTVRVIAMTSDGQPVTPFEYDLTDTPCEQVLGAGYRHFPERVQLMFADPHPRQLNAEGYAGISLFDTGGKALGILVVMDRKPLRDAGLTEQLLRIFSVRAAVELERRHADREARQKAEQYEATFNATSDGMALWTLDGKLVDVNQACCNLHGMTREQLLKAPLTDYVPPQSMPKLMKLLETVREGRTFQDEAIATHKNGEVFHLDMRGVPAVFQGQRHVLLVLRDITKRKAAEEALRASEERYHTIFNASVDGFALCTPDGRIMEANPAFCRLHGYSREELLAAESFQFVHPSSQLRCWAFFEAASGGHSLSSEATAQRKDGSFFDAEVHGVPVHYGNEPHLLLIMRDITDRKQAETERGRLEAQLRQAQKMEAIGQLTGGIAHDFNNILTGITGYIVMAQEWEQKQPDDKLRRYLDRIQKSANRARDLIQQMLTFSRGQRGEPRPLRPGPLVKESVKLLESTLPSTIQTRLAIAGNLPTIVADPVHLEQVLLNLCINARDAMAGSGTLDIGLRQVECATPCICSSCRKPVAGRYLELCVGDTGSGMSREIIDRVFEPFFTTKQVGKGSGMGLAMVHGIVHEYGGHIRVESEPGKGSRFCVLLPVAETMPSAGCESDDCDPAAAPTAALRGEVLLVEDDPNVREVMDDRLRDWGLTVTACANGAEALRASAGRNRPFDFYLFDYTMPGMTGIELARQMRAMQPGVRPVLYTGYGEELSADALNAAGIREVLRKPVELERLRLLIEQAIAGHRP
jgi:PAS domain S-box-containing protein